MTKDQLQVESKRIDSLGREEFNGIVESARSNSHGTAFSLDGDPKTTLYAANCNIPVLNGNYVRGCGYYDSDRTGCDVTHLWIYPDKRSEKKGKNLLHTLTPEI